MATSVHVTDMAFLFSKNVFADDCPLHEEIFISTLYSSGMAALDSKASGKMGMRAVIYYMSTTFIAVFVGIIVVLIIHPGKGSKEEFGKQQTIEQVSPADAFLDLIR